MITKGATNLIRTLLTAAIAVGSCVSAASAQDIVLCGFVSKKTGEAIGYNLAVEPGNPRAVETAFYKGNEEIRHLNGGQPYWYISKSPNGGRNYTYGPDPRYVISVAPGSSQRVSLQAGRFDSWNAGLFVNYRLISKPYGSCMVPVAVEPSVPSVEQLPNLSTQQPSMPQQLANEPLQATSDDLGAAFDANQ